MLDVSGTSVSTPKQIDNVQYFGRFVSASGFTLLVLGVFSRTGYLLRCKLDWVLMALFMTLCSLPFVMTFGEIIYSLFTGYQRNDTAFDPEMVWAMMPIIGISMIFIPLGLRRRWVLCGIIVMAWPAMFFGQKLMVERYLISPTSWQERVNARYMLMARSGAEDCLLSWGGLDFCDAQYKGEDLRSLNAIFGALIMYAPDEVVRQVSGQKENILINLSKRDGWFGVDEAYGVYMQKIDLAKEHIDEKFTAQKRQFMASVYWPYKHASDGYLQVTDPNNLNQLINDSWQNIDNRTEEAWRDYQAGVEKYLKIINGLSRDFEVNVVRVQHRFAACRSDFCRRTVRAKEKYFRKIYGKKLEGIERICGGDLLKYNCKINQKDIVRLMRKKSDLKFKKDYGYPPTLSRKEDFLSFQKSQQIMSVVIEKEVAKELKKKNLDLQDWETLPTPLTKKYFMEYMKYFIVSTAQKQWRENVIEKFGKFILPGLKPTELYEVLSGSPIALKKDFKILNKKEFSETYMMDEYRARAVKYFDNIIVEAPLYANGLKKSQLGKDFIRALYIPPIALGLSLVIVALTLGKNIIFLGGKIGRKYLNSNLYLGRGVRFIPLASWIVFIAICGAFVQTRHNEYTKTQAYQLYYKRAHQASPAVANSLDAIVRVQPFMYRQGALVIETLEIKKWW